MTVLLQVYKCEICGNIVEVVHTGPGKLVCCGKPMILQVENNVDAATEKHVPVIEKEADGYKVSVGSTSHPMMDAHYVEWIELLADGIAYRKFLKPGEEPVARFCVEAQDISAREFCNLHGLWKGQ